MKNIHTISIIRNIPEPNPLDCQLLGISCIYNGQPALVCEERWFTSESDSEAKSYLLILYGDNQDSYRSRKIFTILVGSDDLIPIERDTDAARRIASYILANIAQELGFLKEKYQEWRECDIHKHPLVGIPCYYKGDVALPFGLFKIVWPVDENAGRFEPETHLSLAFLIYKRDWLDYTKMIVGLEWEEPDCVALMPIMRDTIQARRAYHDLVSTLEKELADSREPKPKEASPKESVPVTT